MAKETMSFTFEVLVDTLPGEMIGLTGDLEELGKWNPKNSVFLQQKSTPAQLSEGYSVWVCTVAVPKIPSMKYRYFTCHFANGSSDFPDVIISRWEASYEPRVWTPSEDYLNDVRLCDTFGSIGCAQDCISKGWLTVQTEVNLCLIPGCIRLCNEDWQITAIECTPFQMKPETSQQSIQPWSKMLKYTLNKTDYIPTLPVKSSSYQPDDVMMFKIQVLKTENLGFQFDFYGIPSKYDEAVTSKRHIGYSCLFLSKLKDSLGEVATFISSADQKMQGEFKVKYSITKPLDGHECSLNFSHQKSLNYENYPIHIGHRGMGSSFNTSAPQMENTLASFNTAGRYGAQCVEMDVHLTKDLTPVVYHDFTVYVAMEKKDDNDAASNHVRMSVKNLTLQQLKTLKLFYYLPEASQWVSIADSKNSHEVPFPTLLECLNKVKEDIGFCIELKYPCELVNGEYEDNTWYDANMFSDVILSLILKHCGNRKILLSTFQPDLCVMLQRKQNKFPVLFLTQGETQTWPPYKDLRTQTVETGIRFAKAEGLFGICALTENLLRNENLIKMCHENHLPLFSWGKDNDNHDNLRFLTKKGLVGLIYNRMDVYGPGAP